MSFVEGLRPTEGYDRFEEVTDVRNEKNTEIRDENHREVQKEHGKTDNQIDFTI